MGFDINNPRGLPLNRPPSRSETVARSLISDLRYDHKLKKTANEAATDVADLRAEVSELKAEVAELREQQGPTSPRLQPHFPGRSSFEDG